jgi:peptide chain release factor 1
VAEEEIDAAKADIAQIDEALQLMLIPKDLDDKRAAFVELRPALATNRCLPPTCSVCVTCLSRAQRWRSRSSANRPANSVATRKWCCIDGLLDILGVGVLR